MVDFEIKLNQDKEKDFTSGDNYNNKGKFFKIYFSLIDLNYYIKDLESGNGTFMKIQSKYNLSNNSLINIGDSYMVITFGDSNGNMEISPKVKLNETPEDNINIKIFSGKNQYEPL